MNAENPRVFISYATEDGATAAADLRARLEAEQLSIWQDLHGLVPGEDWWRQCEDAIAKAEYLVTVVTDGALKSGIVRREWQHARDVGTGVIPVMEDRRVTFDGTPAWMTHIHFVREGKEQWDVFLNTLRAPCAVPRVSFMAADLHDGFVDRPQERDAVVEALVGNGTGGGVALTTALQGAGGFGKTVLARAVCHDDRVREAFYDGVLWVTLGEKPSEGHIVGRLEALIAGILRKGEQPPAFSNREDAVTELRQRLTDLRALIVVDDVWNEAHLRPFLEGGPTCRRLITTRIRTVAPKSARPILVDRMRLVEAKSLLRQALPDGEDDAIEALTKRLGEWPILLTLVNSVLRSRVVDSKEPLAAAIDYANRALDRRNLKAFDPEKVEERDQAIEATLSVSIELLAENEQERLRELAVFPEDVHVPLKAVETFWAESGNLDDLDTDELCGKLFSLSLLLDRDLANRRILLHDVVRSYLLPTKREERQALHNRLIDAYRKRLADGWAAGPQDDGGYYFQYLPYHLAEAGRREELAAFVLDSDVQDKRMADPYGVNASFELALKTAIGSGPLAAAPLAIKLALGWQAFRQSRLDSTRLFKLARQGELAEFEKELSLYPIDQQWRAAARLTAAWLAPESARTDADSLRRNNSSGTDLDSRVNAMFGVGVGAFQAIDEPVDPGQIEQIFMEFGIMDAEARASVRADTDREENRNLVATVAPKIVAFAQAHPKKGTNKFNDFLGLMASNEYREYRNESLWGILCATVRHSDDTWVQGRLQDVIAAACAGSGRAFSGAVHAALAGLMDRDGMRSRFDKAVHAALEEHQSQSGIRGDSDTWSELLRTFCALAEVKTVFFQEDASDLIARAERCHQGYAGYRSSACLTLAESVEICGVGGECWGLESALHEAHAAARNILNPEFCMRSVSRVRALDLEWWRRAPLSKPDLEACVVRFYQDPQANEYTARDRFDERQESLRDRTHAWDMREAWQAQTLYELADAYGISPSDLLAANPDVQPDADLSNGTIVRVPDPHFPPILAAFFAAKVLSEQSFSREKRVELILKLVAPACSNPTALDTVLARLLLAMRPEDDAQRSQLKAGLEEITEAVRAYAPPCPGIMKALGV